MNTVKLKSYNNLKKLVKEGQIKMINVSDSGEWITYGVIDGPFTHILHTHIEDHGTEYEVTKLQKHISESQLKVLRILFE